MIRSIYHRIEGLATLQGKVITPLISFCEKNYLKIYFKVSNVDKRGNNLPDIQSSTRYGLACVTCPYHSFVTLDKDGSGATSYTEKR